MDRTQQARRLLNRRGIAIPETDEEVRMRAYEELKEEDFIMAHVFRLNKERIEFIKEDWASILELSGKEKVSSNMASLMACLAHGLISPQTIS